MTNKTASTQTFTRRRSLSVPLMSLNHTPHAFVKVTGELREEHMPGLATKGDGTVTIVPVIDLETGEDKILLCLSMLTSALNHVPEGYVGKCFEVQVEAPRPGKSYKEIEVWEIDCPVAQ